MRVHLAILLLAAAPAAAQTVTLRSGNSVAGVTPRNGMTTWFIDGGRDNVFISNYYARIGTEGIERPLSELIGVPTVGQSSADRVTFRFAGPQLNAQLDWTLAGGVPGSALSTITKALTLTNAGADPLSIALFDYTDFDIRFNQASQRDQSVFLNARRLLTTNAAQPLQIMTLVSPRPDHRQISNFFTLYSSFFIDLDGPTQLNDLPAIGTPFPVPAGDNAFAFQWDFSLAPGESFGVDQVSRFGPVPSPAAAGLLALGLAVVASRRRR